MKIKIIEQHSEDYMFNEVKVVINGEEVANVYTSDDSPEDNDCGRMKIAEQFEKIIRAVASTNSIEGEIEKVTEVI